TRVVRAPDQPRSTHHPRREMVATPSVSGRSSVGGAVLRSAQLLSWNHRPDRSKAAMCLLPAPQELVHYRSNPPAAATGVRRRTRVVTARGRAAVWLEGSRDDVAAYLRAKAPVPLLDTGVIVMIESIAADRGLSEGEAMDRIRLVLAARRDVGTEHFQ